MVYGEVSVTLLIRTFYTLPLLHRTQGLVKVFLWFRRCVF